jgi:hypothetical protein
MGVDAFFLSTLIDQKIPGSSFGITGHYSITHEVSFSFVFFFYIKTQTYKKQKNVTNKQSLLNSGILRVCRYVLEEKRNPHDVDFVYVILKSLVDFGTNETRNKILTEIPLSLVLRDQFQSVRAAYFVLALTEHRKIVFVFFL